MYNDKQPTIKKSNTMSDSESKNSAIAAKKEKGQTVLSMTEVNQLDTNLNPLPDNDATVLLHKSKAVEAQTDFDQTRILTPDLDETVLAGATSLQEDDKTEIIQPSGAETTDFDATAVLANDEATVLAGSTEAFKPAPRPTFTPRLGVGSTINDRFTLERLLGRGGMGEVYLATDKRKLEAQDKNPYIAMKVLGENFKQHPKAFIALQREARKTQELAHPNIVTVYDFDRQGESIYLTMEALDGKPLDEEIRNDARAPSEAVDMITQCSRGLAYAHEKGLVHSDLKPGNLFICNDGKVKLLDFGIARAFKSGKDLDENTEASQNTVFDAGDLGALTPAYASLEMINGEEPHLADDVYALGLIAYELLTGKHPFNKIMASKAQEQGLKPERIKSINKQQWSAIERALCFDREDRIQNAGEFLEQFTAKSKAPLYAAAALILLAFIAVGSINFFINPSIGPDIPFEQLPPAQQQAISAELENVTTALSFNDLSGAVLHLNKAFELHPYNREVLAQAEKIVERSMPQLQKMEPAMRSKQASNLLAYPAFTNNEDLQQLKN